MQIFNLNNNPFYLLEASPRDKRATIISKAEEKAFFFEDDSSEVAQTTLLNPSKRLLAELDWFLDVDKNKIKEIRDCISKGEEISTEDLSPVSKVNALLFNLCVMRDVQTYDIGFALTSIDEQFSLLSAESIVDTINDCRKNAGMIMVSESEVDGAIDAKRDIIRQVFTEKLQKVSNENYIEFVSTLANQYIADPDYDDGIIISDVLDQYEIRVQVEIQKHAEAVKNFIDYIKELEDESAIEESIDELIRKVKMWDFFVKPLQLRSQASGVPHDSSLALGQDIRGLVLHLHNEEELTAIAAKLALAMYDMFAEVGYLADQFEEDAEQLDRILDEESVAKEFLSKIEALKVSADEMGFYTTVPEVDSFIAQMKRLDATVKTRNIDYKLKSEIRKSICAVAREAAIKLHNNYKNTDLALRLAKAIFAQFSDINELKSRLQEDVQTLNEQSIALAHIQAVKREQEESAKMKKIVGWAFIGLILFIILAGNLSQCDDSSSSYSSPSKYNSNYSSSYYSSSGSSASSAGSSNKSNKIKIALTASNFETYFTVTASAKYVGNIVTIDYSISPKSTLYASDSLSSSSITVKLKGGVYPYSFSTTPTNSKTETITLNKSSGYKKSGTITVYVSSASDEIYWGTSITSASGTIYK